MRQLVIFFVIGSLLFAGKRALEAHLEPPVPLTVWTGPHEAAERAIDRALLADSALAAGAELMDPVIRERLLTLLSPDPHAPMPEDAALLRAARELDLFHRDLLLETRLAANAELRIRSGLQLSAPSRARLEAYLQAHAERYQRSERFSFVQVFVSRRAHPDPVRAAAQLREQLIASGIDGPSSGQQGEPCNLPQRVEQSSSASIEARFGGAIARALPGLSVGSWSAPLPSPLGAHLIWLTGHQPARPATLAEVEQRVRTDFLEQAREAAFARTLAELRSARTIVASPAAALQEPR